MKSAEAFKAVMAALSELYQVEVTKALTDLYWLALEPYDDQQVKDACTRGMRVWKCWKRLPTPAEILEQIEGTDEERAHRGWETLLKAITRLGAYGSPTFEDVKIARCVELLGGWIHVCSTWRVEEQDFHRASFLRAYKGLQGEGNSTGRLIGIHETNNAALGYEPDELKALPQQSVAEGLLELREVKEKALRLLGMDPEGEQK